MLCNDQTPGNTIETTKQVALTQEYYVTMLIVKCLEYHLKHARSYNECDKQKKKHYLQTSFLPSQHNA